MFSFFGRRAEAPPANLGYRDQPPQYDGAYREHAPSTETAANASAGNESSHRVHEHGHTYGDSARQQPQRQQQYDGQDPQQRQRRSPRQQHPQQQANQQHHRGVSPFASTVPQQQRQQHDTGYGRRNYAPSSTNVVTSNSSSIANSSSHTNHVGRSYYETSGNRYEPSDQPSPDATTFFTRYEKDEKSSGSKRDSVTSSSAGNKHLEQQVAQLQEQLRLQAAIEGELQTQLSNLQRKHDAATHEMHAELAKRERLVDQLDKQLDDLSASSKLTESELSQRVADMTRERDHLTERLEKLQEQQVHHEGLLQGRTKYFEQKLELTSEEFRNLQADYEREKQQRLQLTTEVDSLNQLAQRVQPLIDQLGEQKEKYTTLQSERATEVKELRQELKKAQEEGEEYRLAAMRAEGTQEELNRLRDQLKTVTKQAEEKAQEMQASVEHWKGKAAAAEEVANAGVKLLREQLDAVESSSSSQLEQVTTLKVELDEWQRVATDAQTKLQSAKETVAELDEQLQNKKALADEKEMQVQVLQTDIKRLESELLLSVNTVELHKEEVKELQARLKMLQQEKSSNEEETATQVNHIRSKVAQMQEEIQAKSKEHLSALAELTSLQEQAQRKEDALSALDAEARILKTTGEEKDEELTAMAVQVEYWKDRAETSEQSTQKIEGQMQQQVEDLTLKIKQLGEEYEIKTQSLKASIETERQLARQAQERADIAEKQLAKHRNLEDKLASLSQLSQSKQDELDVTEKQVQQWQQMAVRTKEELADLKLQHDEAKAKLLRFRELLNEHEERIEYWKARADEWEGRGIDLQQRTSVAEQHSVQYLQQAQCASEELQFYRERARFLELERLKQLRIMMGDVLERELQESLLGTDPANATDTIKEQHDVIHIIRPRSPSTKTHDSNGARAVYQAGLVQQHQSPTHEPKANLDDQKSGTPKVLQGPSMEDPGQQTASNVGLEEDAHGPERSASTTHGLNRITIGNDTDVSEMSDTRNNPEALSGHGDSLLTVASGSSDLHAGANGVQTALPPRDDTRVSLHDEDGGDHIQEPKQSRFEELTQKLNEQASLSILAADTAEDEAAEPVPAYMLPYLATRISTMLELCTSRAHSLDQARRQLDAALKETQRKLDAASAVSDELGRQVLVQNMLGKVDMTAEAAWKKAMEEVNLVAMARNQIQTQHDFVQDRSTKVVDMQNEMQQMDDKIKDASRVESTTKLPVSVSTRIGEMESLLQTLEAPEIMEFLSKIERQLQAQQRQLQHRFQPQIQEQPQQTQPSSQAALQQHHQTTVPHPQPPQQRAFTPPGQDGQPQHQQWQQPMPPPQQQPQYHQLHHQQPQQQASQQQQQQQQQQQAQMVGMPGSAIALSQGRPAVKQRLSGVLGQVFKTLADPYGQYDSDSD